MNVTLFTPYQSQREFINKFVDTSQLFGVCVAPRGSGKTLLGMNVLLYWMLKHAKAKGGWISPVYSQAKSVYDQIVLAGNEVISQKNRQDLIITFVNGSTIKFLSTDNADSIRGFRFTHLILDEVAFMKSLAIDQVILPTLNPNGKKCLMISTPKGKNHFYDWYLKGNIDGNTINHKIPLTECPYVSEELIQEAKRSLPPELFKQEFLGEFVDAGNDVFTGIDVVTILNQFDRTRKVDAVVGIDTGLSNDSSVLTVMSETGRVLWIEDIVGQNINIIAQTFKDIMEDFNITGGYIEVNGIGAAMFDLIGPFYRKVRPFTMSQASKTELVRKLIKDISDATIELPSQELSPELYNQLSSYTYKISPSGGVSFSAPNGQHDDFVTSLMLANSARSQFLGIKSMNVGTVRRGGSINPSFGNLPR